MELSLSREELQYYIAKQLEYRFPDRKSCLDFSEISNRRALNEALERLEFCFIHIKVKGYTTENLCGGGGKTVFF